MSTPRPLTSPLCPPRPLPVARAWLKETINHGGQGLCHQPRRTVTARACSSDCQPCSSPCFSLAAPRSPQSEVLPSHPSPRLEGEASLAVPTVCATGSELVFVRAGRGQGQQHHPDARWLPVPGRCGPPIPLPSPVQEYHCVAQNHYRLLVSGRSGSSWQVSDQAASGVGG